MELIKSEQFVLWPDTFLKAALVNEKFAEPGDAESGREIPLQKHHKHQIVIFIAKQRQVYLDINIVVHYLIICVSGLTGFGWTAAVKQFATK